MYLEFKPYLGNKIKKKRICVSVCQFVFTIIKKKYIEEICPEKLAFLSKASDISNIFFLKKRG